jgi:large subunit ribosomal protein L29
MPNKMKEFRGMSDEQLSLALKDTEKHLFQLRFQSATDRLETPSEIRKARRDIARLKSLQREKELAELEALPADQLGTRIAGLEAKEAASAPGKRAAHRRGARLKRFYAAKGGTLPVAATAAPPRATAGAGAKKDETKKPDAKSAAKGSGK